MVKKMYIALLSSLFSCANAQKAIVVVPVADLVGAPIKSFKLAPTNKESYEKIGLCGGVNQAWLGCPRIGQILFNELVDIISIQKELHDESEVCIRVPSVFFVSASNPKPQNIFWTLAKNVRTLESINQKGFDTHKFPSFQNDNVMVLLEPFFDAATRQTFSAGTFFVYDPYQSTSTHYTCFLYDKTHNIFKTTMIPTEISKQPLYNNPDQSIKFFVQLLKNWAHTPGFIFYVWGGCSLTHYSPFNQFKEGKKKLETGKKANAFERIPQPCQCPLTGMDCAGLILCAAKISNIPYHFKNTYTLARYLTPLNSYDVLHEGDLIWIPGHVMVVSDLQNNKLIEARGYSHGYGIVQEIPLSEEFKEIDTYAQLLQNYYKKEPLRRLNKEGQEVEKISNFKLLKLSSAWKKT